MDLLLVHLMSLWLCESHQRDTQLWKYSFKTWALKSDKLCNLYVYFCLQMPSKLLSEHTRFYDQICHNILFMLKRSMSLFNTYNFVDYWYLWKIFPLVSCVAWSSIVICIILWAIVVLFHFVQELVNSCFNPKIALL